MTTSKGEKASKIRELGRKARFLIELKKDGDIRYQEFCIKLMLASNKTMNFVEFKIIQYSKL